ncbi:hypothetical protein Taro_045863 [Colocasia esculenta]|uniref:Uncharacterized protein n=1 Tax=Colocasia esculenta TaxID=4460 RepID=A0A843WQN2_COLES|nr:hypothetical protein [Colocasia esculenta]
MVVVRPVWCRRVVCVGVVQVRSRNEIGPAAVELELAARGTEGCLEDRGTCGGDESREESPVRGVVPVGVRGGFGVNQEIAGVVRSRVVASFPSDSCFATCRGSCVCDSWSRFNQFESTQSTGGSTWSTGDPFIANESPAASASTREIR